ncbi:MAG: hypothetical protein ACJ76N_11485 [Thermoanaerobaculia bacterium]
MPRIVRVVPVILLALGSHAALAQETGEAARSAFEMRNSISRYLADAQARAKDLGRQIDVLADLTEAADSVSPIAMSQSLTRARRKVEEAKAEADREPPLREPVPAVVDIVSELVKTPPFGMPADQLRARLFVEISKLEEEILRECDAFQSESQVVEAIGDTLARIRGTLHSTAVAGTRASLRTRRRALKSGL